MVEPALDLTLNVAPAFRTGAPVIIVGDPAATRRHAVVASSWSCRAARGRRRVVAPTDAVTVAVWLVVRTVDALPALPVGRCRGERSAVVVKVTVVPVSALPLTSSTNAVIVELPPDVRELIRRHA